MKTVAAGIASAGGYINFIRKSIAGRCRRRDFAPAAAFAVFFGDFCNYKSKFNL